MTTQRDVHTTATNLQHALHELAEAKGYHMVREVRIMRPTPGPQSPTPVDLFNLELEVYEELRQAVRPIRQQLHPDQSTPTTSAALTTYIRRYSEHVPNCLGVDDLVATMRELTEQVDRKLNQFPAFNNQKGSSDPRLQAVSKLYTAAHAAQVLTQAGYQVDRKHITWLGTSGKINTHYDTNGKACYDLKEIAAYLQQQKTS